MTMQGEELLKGIRVVDFTWVAAGPSGTLALALAGANVIKVESRAKLDNYRKSFGQDGDYDRSMLFAAVNVGKRSVAIDAKQPKGRDAILKLVADADLVVENFSPGAMDRLGLGFDRLVEVNNQIVMVSSSAAGQSGPKRGYSGFASIFCAQGGLAAVTRRPDGTPVQFGRSIDSRVGTAIAVAAMIGLHLRRETGRSYHLDVSGQEAVTAMIGEVVAGGEPDGRDGRCYECADGWIYVEAPRCVDSSSDDIALRCRGISRAEAAAALANVGYDATPVPAMSEIVPGDGDALMAPWGRTIHPLMGSIASLASPIRWPSVIAKRQPIRPAPCLGEHTDEVLTEVLGYAPSDVERARQQGLLR
jgi:crotonobetainyl-CoA:carnitine CoA-transferase CaiB-like acyl-CoA transferase